MKQKVLFLLILIAMVALFTVTAVAYPNPRYSDQDSIIMADDASPLIVADMSNVAPNYALNASGAPPIYRAADMAIYNVIGQNLRRQNVYLHGAQGTFTVNIWNHTIDPANLSPPATQEDCMILIKNVNVALNPGLSRGSPYSQKNVENAVVCKKDVTNNSRAPNSRELKDIFGQTQTEVLGTVDNAENNRDIILMNSGDQYVIGGKKFDHSWYPNPFNV